MSCALEDILDVCCHSYLITYNLHLSILFVFERRRFSFLAWMPRSTSLFICFGGRQFQLSFT